MQKPTIPTKDELYDLLMSQIEPDLTNSQLPLLTQKYASETDTEHTERMVRYAKAFTAYYKALDAYFANLNAQIADYNRGLVEGVKGQVQAEEQKQLSSLESMFSS